MLLVFADRLRDELPRILGVPELRRALCNLTRAYDEGKHILLGPFPVLGKLADARELPEDVRATFRQLRQRHNDFTTLRGRVTCFAEIEPDDGAIREECVGEQQRYRVPLSYFGDSSRTQASRLVAEDDDDARVYLAAACAYVFRERSSLAVRLDEYGGGGSSTADTLRSHARRGPTVCVVDGDFKWSPEEGEPSEGQTASGVRRAALDLAGKAMCAVYVLPCRETENLLPPALVLSCLRSSDKGEFVAQCERAAALGLFGGGPSVNRLDLKKGLRRKDYEDLTEGRERRYLMRVFEEHNGRASRPKGGWCGDEPRCAGPEPCTCVLFGGLGDHFLKRVADRLVELTPQKIAEYLLADGQPNEPAWTEVGSILFSWGCGYTRKRT